MGTHRPASMPITAAVPLNLGAITSSRSFKPSRLSLDPNEQQELPPDATAQQQDIMSSSPTTNSFYTASTSSSSRRTTGAGAVDHLRSYKSQVSTRQGAAAARRRPRQSGAAASSSSPTSLATVTLNAHRLHSRWTSSSASIFNQRRDLSQGEPGNPYEPGTYGPGGLNKDGEWEEWTDEEAWRLGIEAMRAKKDWDRRKAALAPSPGEMSRWVEEEEQEQDEHQERVDEEPEPPIDVLWEDSIDPEELYETLVAEQEQEASQEQPPSDLVFQESEGDPAQLLADAMSRPRIPSLASDHGSVAPSEQSSEAGLDDGMDIDDVERNPISPSMEAVQTFIRDIEAQMCPHCKSGQLHGSTTGLQCARCLWQLTALIADPLARSFAMHHGGDFLKHRPLLEANPWTGTSILCSACDEIIAA